MVNKSLSKDTTVLFNRVTCTDSVPGLPGKETGVRLMEWHVTNLAVSRRRRVRWRGSDFPVRPRWRPWRGTRTPGLPWGSARCTRCPWPGPGSPAPSRRASASPRRRSRGSCRRPCPSASSTTASPSSASLRRRAALPAPRRQLHGNSVSKQLDYTNTFTIKDDMQRFFTKLMQKSFLADYCNINPSV